MGVSWLVEREVGAVPFIIVWYQSVACLLFCDLVFIDTSYAMRGLARDFQSQHVAIRIKEIHSDHFCMIECYFRQKTSQHKHECETTKWKLTVSSL